MESSQHNVLNLVKENRRALFWIVSVGLFLWLAFAVKEITALVLLSYGLAILLDPLVTRLEKLKLSRSFSVVGILVSFLVLIFAMLWLAVPAIITEYAALIKALPNYLQSLGTRLENGLSDYGKFDIQAIVQKAKNYVSALGVEQLKPVTKAIGDTVLRWYSFTLTIINMFLLPFFVYYITRDLKTIHSFIGGFLQPEVRNRVANIGGEILGHVYSFFRGQLTVSCMMAVLYMVGLLIVGLPYAVIVGAVAGLLNIVPYLGIALGIVLATIITVVSDFSWIQLGKVGSVFLIVQAIEGTLLTPKIVGESVGIHPLGVMLALIIGGQLFGLLGLILAIPAAAAIRVLFRHLRKIVEGREDAVAVDA